jgi:hypothetical protein
MKTTRSMILFGLTVAVAAGCSSNSYDSPSTPTVTPRQVVTGSGDITATVAQFRTVLGDPNNGGTAGAQAAGRREVTWDGVPADQTNTDTFPGDFFNTRSPRGLITSTAGRGFRTSDTNVADIDAGFAQEFAPFSPRKTFLAIGSTVTDVSFRVPGSGTEATVSGFGVVFSDVDRAGTTIEFFGREGSLGRFDVPVRGAGSSLSFLGVAFDGKIVTGARIVAGTGVVAAGNRDVSAGGTQDLVIMDDFLYDEPRAIQ